MEKGIDWKTIYEMMDNMLTGLAFIELSEDKLEFLYINNGGFRMLGYTPENGYRYVNNMLSMILEEDKPKFWQAVEDVLKDDGAVDFEIRTVTASGSLRWLQIRANLYERTEDRAILLCVFMDATDRKFVESELLLQSQWYQMFLETEGEFLFDYNAKTDVMVVKKASKYGIESEEIVDRYMIKARAPENQSSEIKQLIDVMESALKIPQTDVIELCANLRPKQEKRWYRIHTSSIAGVDGYVTHIIGRVTDIHETKLLMQKVSEGNKLDALTGWLNQEEVKAQIGHALEHSRESEIHAFILVDLSAFRFISKNLGEKAGNQVIKEVTEKIGKGFKRSDILGRISEDEFVLFVQNLVSISNLDAVASRVSRSAEVTFGSGEDGFTLAGSVGVSVYPYQGSGWSELYIRAEKAVNTLKENNKAGYHIYNLSGIYRQERNENKKLLTTYDDVGTVENLEEMLVQMLCEKKQNENLIRMLLKLIAKYYGFHKAYLSLDGIKGGPEAEFHYFVPEYAQEEGKDSHTWFSFLKQMDMLEGFQILHNYDPIPEELSSYMIYSKIHTMIIQPMLMRGKVSGVFIMGECTGRDWRLKKSEEASLRRILQLVQMYVLRYERQQLGLATLQDVHILDDFDSYVMAIDYDTYELCFANRRMLEAIPDLQIGDYCYWTFARQDRPCDMCVMKSLDRNDPHAHRSEERFCTQMRSWLKVHASWLQNDADGATCLLNCMDISEYFMDGSF